MLTLRSSKKMKNFSVYKTLILCVAFMLPTLFAFSQNVWDRADKAYNAGDYELAIDLYHQALDKNRDTRTLRKLAKSYLMKRDGDRSAFYYDEVCASEEALAEDFLNYGKALKMNGQYARARKQGELFLESGGNQDIGNAFIESCEFSENAQQGPSRYSVKNVPFNSNVSDMSPQFYQHGLVFSSNRDKGHMIKYSDSETGQPFFDLYFVDLRTGSSVAEPLKGAANSRLNDAAVSFSKDESTMYFTRNHLIDGEAHISEDGQNKLCVLQTEFAGKKWKGINVLHFNNMDYSCGHPSISDDGNMLFYVSDAPGGMGGTDIYVCFWEDDAWSQPTNLGDMINTPDNEIFPFIYNNEVLFFSTEGHPGLGGLDVFYVTYKDGEWGEVQNAGYPLNSSADDYSITLNETGTTGYFASNRDGGMGEEDIYQFKTKAKVVGTVRDAFTQDPIPNAEVIVHLDNNDSETVMSDKDGKYEVYMRYNTSAMFRAKAANYKESKQKVSTRDVAVMKDIEVDFEMDRDNLYTVTGRIHDEVSGAALPGVGIKVLGPGDDISSETSTDGSYTEKVGYREGDYQVLFFKDGYVPQTRKFSTKGIQKPTDFTYDVNLKEGKGIVVEGTVVQKGTGAGIPSVDVACIDAEAMKEMHAGRTDDNGRFFAIIDESKPTYITTGSKNRYFAKRVDVPHMDSINGVTWEVKIEMSPYKVGEMVERIHFGYNRAKIGDDAGRDLYSLVYFLKDNPEASVEVSAHTDSRGSLEYNLGLSRRRAKAVKDFIVSRGIEESRIKYTGYGENRLLNECGDGVPCSDEKHMENRRCELKVIGLDGN